VSKRRCYLSDLHQRNEKLKHEIEGRVSEKGFPRTIDVRARTITDEMCLAAAKELAKLAEERGLSERHIIPTIDNWEVFPREATAVAEKAIEQCVARIGRTRDELYASARLIIKRARERAKYLMRSGFIQEFPT
jgi:malate dehydrogenase (oxaloacetate-decarboxylating)